MTWGRNGRDSGAYQPPATSAADSVACKPTKAPSGSESETASTRGLPARQPYRLAERGLHRRLPRDHATCRADLLDLARRPRAEEAERDVEILGPDRAQARYTGKRSVAPLRQRRPRRFGQLKCDEQAGTLVARGAHARSAPAPASGTSAPSPTRSRRSRCIATVVERSRMSDRLPGNSSRRVRRAPSREQTEKHTVPTGFSSVPPPGPAMPVMPIP